MLKIGQMSIVLAVVIGLFIGGDARAVTTEFTGATNSDWHTGSNWTGGVPGEDDYAIIQSGKTATISADATADHINVQSTATLNINAAYKLTLELTLSTDVSTINGTMNLEGSGSELEFKTSNHTLQGGGKIVGKHDAAILDANGGAELISQITIEGQLKIIGSDFHNEGIVKANRTGAIWVNCGDIHDISTAVWQVDINLLPGADPDTAVLRIDDTNTSSVEMLVGAFNLNDGVLNIDAGFCCTGTFTQVRGRVIGDSTGSFKTTCQ